LLFVALIKNLFDFMNRQNNILLY